MITLNRLRKSQIAMREEGKDNKIAFIITPTLNMSLIVSGDDAGPPSSIVIRRDAIPLLIKALQNEML